MREAFLVAAAVLAAACSTNPPPETPGPGVWEEAPPGVPGVALNYAMARGGERAAPLTEELGLVPGGLGDTALVQLLRHPLALPAHLAVGILYLPARQTWYDNWWGGSALSLTESQELAESTVAVLSRSPRVSRAAVLPPFVLGDKHTVEAIREGAARFQADVMLVYRPGCRVFRREPFIGRTEWKSVCTVEAVAVDTRTGLLPFARVVTKQDISHRTKDDATEAATVERSQTAAIQAALADVGLQLGSVLVTVPVEP